MISPVMLQASLGINRSLPKEFAGVRTPLQVERWLFAVLAAPTEPAAAPLLQLERVQQVLRKETHGASLHGDVALQSRIISSSWPALRVTELALQRAQLAVGSPSVPVVSR